MFSIRLADESDIEDISRVHYESIIATFSSTIPEYASARNLSDFEAAWRGRFIKRDCVTAVLVNDLGIEGFASAERSLDDDASPRAGEIGRIYLHPRVWGRRLGDGLMRWCEDSLLKQGYTVALLWVFEANSKARKFYERLDYRVDGAAKTAYHAALLRYQKDLCR